MHTYQCYTICDVIQYILTLYILWKCVKLQKLCKNIQKLVNELIKQGESYVLDPRIVLLIVPPEDDLLFTNRNCFMFFFSLFNITHHMVVKTRKGIDKTWMDFRNFTVKTTSL